ncbi:MAG: ATP-binding protein [Bulleidia sp.]|nr:ATP-binding protein [Bulleidia sp.]
MRRLDFRPVEETAEEKQKKQQEIQKLLADPAVRKLMQKREIPAQVIASNFGAVSAWRREIQPCMNCKGLSECRQKQKGCRMSLSYDGLLQYVLEACPYQAEKEKKEAFLSSYLINDAGTTFADADFLLIDWAKEPAKYARPAMEAQKLYAMGSGVYLYGAMGTGKTYLAACAGNACAKAGKRPAFVYAPGFASAAARSPEKAKDMISLMKYADFLVLDDIGAEEITTEYLATLLDILDVRMRESKTTWFTSNEDFNSLANRYTYARNNQSLMQAKRILERIRALSKPVQLDGNDRRNLSSMDE